MSADVHALAGAYALDALPDDERAFFERHLAACDACRLEVAELTETAARLGSGAVSAPPPGLRERILAAADVTRQLPPQAEPEPARPMPSTWARVRDRALMPVAACLALVVVALSGMVLNLNRQLEQDADPDAAVVAVLGASDLETVDLDMDGGGPGRFLFSPSQDQGVLVAAGMPTVSDDKTYELWLIHDGTPVPAGLFRPDGSGAAVAQVEGIVRGAELVAVTVEPAAGSKRPTGEILASADL